MSATGANVAVRINSVSKAFGAKQVLEGIDLTIHRGEFVALLGPSGTGKTTLLRLLAGLETPDSGELLVPARRTTVYQEPRLILSRRVIKNVTLGQRGNDARIRAEAALEEVGLPGIGRNWPATLSGGESQRVALARALVREPELLLLDEPFAALDALTRLQMQDLMSELCERHRPAVLLVTHDVDEAITLADRVAVLREGSFACIETVDSPRPRDRNDPQVLDQRRRLLAQLGVSSELVSH